jgi:hypothetical protein
MKFLMNSVTRNEARVQSIWQDLFTERNEDPKDKMFRKNNQLVVAGIYHPKFVKEKPPSFPASETFQQRVGTFSPEFLTCLPQKPKSRAPEMKSPGLSAGIDIETATKDGISSANPKSTESQTNDTEKKIVGNQNSGSTLDSSSRSSPEAHSEMAVPLLSDVPVTVDEAVELTEKSKQHLLKELADNIWNDNLLCEAEGSRDLEAEVNKSLPENITEEEAKKRVQVEELGTPVRGLLTEIPLILEPQDIEALPMLINTGIVGWKSNDVGSRRQARPSEGRDPMSLRCHMFLASEKGRNLFREMLIYVALWDLSEDELYFKLMSQIMDAILEEGLAPFAYDAFSE